VSVGSDRRRPADVEPERLICASYHAGVMDTDLRVPLLPAPVRWVAVALLTGFVFYTSILTVPPETAVDQLRPDLLPLDKWRHLLAYAAVAGSLAYATADWAVERRRLALGVFLVTVAYGVGIEAGQSALPARTSRWATPTPTHSGASSSCRGTRSARG
jgi:VanZ family protein